jgi:histidine triad (HIT) family protein
MKKALFQLSKSKLGELIVGIAFGKFDKLLPVKRVYENDYVLAFWHPKPYWQKHILIVPKKAIKDLHSIKEEEIEYISETHKAIQKIVLEQGFDKTDYTVVTNGGTRQEVKQLHFHLGSGERV